MSKLVKRIDLEIQRQNDKKGLGYESTIDFNLGFLSALLFQKVISKIEYNALKKVHANYNNGDCTWFIGMGGCLEKCKE